MLFPILILNLNFVKKIYNTIFVQSRFNLKTKKYPHKIIKIKKIRIYNCNNILLKKIFFNQFEFKNLNLKKIKKLILFFKESGFIDSIKVLKLFNPNSKTIIFNIRINPIIKKIKIEKYQYLQIPKYVLINLLKKNIGIPKNYYYLNSSLKKIYSWYKDQGFDYIQITTTQDKSLNEISIKIFEGKINKTKLICKTKKNLNKYTLHYIESLIKDELYILPGEILNLKKLKSGILKLKEKNIVNDISYKIDIYNNNTIVIIKYFLQHKNFIAFYKQEVLLNSIKNNNFLILFQNIKIYLFNFITSYSSGIKISFFNYKKKLYSLIVNLRLKKSFLLINLKFFHPYIIIKNKFCGTIFFDFYNDFSNYDIFYSIIKLNIVNFNCKQIFLSNMIKTSSNIEIELNHKIFYGIDILEKIIFTNNIWKKIYINIKNYKFISKKNFFLYNLNKFYQLKRIAKMISPSLIQLQISVPQKNSLLIEPFDYKKKLKFYSEILFLIDIRSINAYKFIGQYINYQYKHFFLLNSNKYYNNKLLLLLEINLFFNKGINSKLVEQDSVNKKKLSSFYLSTIEYHISKSKYVSIYTFICYFQYLSNKVINTNLYKLYSYNQDIYTGLGIKCYMPINKLPSFRLEYRINSIGKNILILRTDSHYN